MLISKITKEVFIREGASLVGITRALDLPELEEEIQKRDRKGLFARMGWLARTAKKRTTPELHLQGAKTIVCTAWSYSSRVDNPCIARYAQHEDYHEFILKRMKDGWKKVLRQTQDEGGKNVCGRQNQTVNALFFVDSKPIAEKAFAQKAGLGWIGKNNLLINKEIGSYFCIGLILTDEEVDSCDKEGKDNCGTCKKCIEACPTAAIVRPGVMDCNKCISYLTTEHKHEISREPDIKMSGKIFGCDACQEACPYNKGKEIKNVIPRIDFKIESLESLLKLDEKGFKRVFKGTPIFRLSLDRLKRNVLIVTGSDPTDP